MNGFVYRYITLIPSKTEQENIQCTSTPYNTDQWQMSTTSNYEHINPFKATLLYHISTPRYNTMLTANTVKPISSNHIKEVLTA